MSGSPPPPPSSPPSATYTLAPPPPPPGIRVSLIQHPSEGAEDDEVARPSALFRHLFRNRLMNGASGLTYTPPPNVPVADDSSTTNRTTDSVPIVREATSATTSDNALALMALLSPVDEVSDDGDDSDPNAAGSDARPTEEGQTESIDHYRRIVEMERLHARHQEMIADSIGTHLNTLEEHCRALEKEADRLLKQLQKQTRTLHTNKIESYALREQNLTLVSQCTVLKSQKYLCQGKVDARSRSAWPVAKSSSRAIRPSCATKTRPSRTLGRTGGAWCVSTAGRRS